MALRSPRGEKENGGGIELSEEKCLCEECAAEEEERGNGITVVTPPDNRSDIQLELTRRESTEGLSIVTYDYIVKIGSSEPLEIVIAEARKLFGEMLDDETG